MKERVKEVMRRTEEAVKEKEREKLEWKRKTNTDNGRVRKRETARVKHSVRGKEREIPKEKEKR